MLQKFNYYQRYGKLLETIGFMLPETDQFGDIFHQKSLPGLKKA